MTSISPISGRVERGGGGVVDAPPLRQVARQGYPDLHPDPDPDPDSNPNRNPKPNPNPKPDLRQVARLQRLDETAPPRDLHAGRRWRQ